MTPPLPLFEYLLVKNVLFPLCLALIIGSVAFIWSTTLDKGSGEKAVAEYRTSKSVESGGQLLSLEGETGAREELVGASRLGVTVVDTTGLAIGQAQVLSTYDEKPGALTVSSEDGSCENLDLDASLHLIWAEGFIPTVSRGLVAGQNIVLQKSATLIFHVSDSIGRPIPNMDVMLISSPTGGGRINSTVEMADKVGIPNETLVLSSFLHDGFSEDYNRVGEILLGMERAGIGFESNGTFSIPITSDKTDADGLASFTGVSPGGQYFASLPVGYMILGTQPEELTPELEGAPTYEQVWTGGRTCGPVGIPESAEAQAPTNIIVSLPARVAGWIDRVGESVIGEVSLLLSHEERIQYSAGTSTLAVMQEKTGVSSKDGFFMFESVKPGLKKLSYRMSVAEGVVYGFTVFEVEDGQFLDLGVLSASQQGQVRFTLVVKDASGFEVDWNDVLSDSQKVIDIHISNGPDVPKSSWLVDEVPLTVGQPLMISGLARGSYKVGFLSTRSLPKLSQMWAYADKTAPKGTYKVGDSGVVEWELTLTVTPK